MVVNNHVNLAALTEDKIPQTTENLSLPRKKCRNKIYDIFINR